MSSINRRVRSIAGTPIATTEVAISGVVVEEFPLESVANGVSAPTQSECQALDNGIWVEVDGKGDCVRYWSSGLTLIRAEGKGHHNLDITGQHVTAWCLQS